MLQPAEQTLLETDAARRATLCGPFARWRSLTVAENSRDRHLPQSVVADSFHRPSGHARIVHIACSLPLAARALSAHRRINVRIRQSHSVWRVDQSKSAWQSLHWIKQSSLKIVNAAATLRLSGFRNGAVATIFAHLGAGGLNSTKFFCGRVSWLVIVVRCRRRVGFRLHGFAVRPARRQVVWLLPPP